MPILKISTESEFAIEDSDRGLIPSPEKQNMPWIEKYRPTHFDHIVLDPLNRVFFRNILAKKHFPHLLFYGPPGTGKTTTIINLINEFQDKYTKKNRESIIHLNASDERGIDIIRTQIYQFVKSKHIFEVGLKFVILDEVDYMTKNAQQALKTLLQTSPANVRFCLICNYISKIDESLQSEFICVRFNQLPAAEIQKFIWAIANKEGLHIDDAALETIREMYQSDIRSMINFLQSMDSIAVPTAVPTTVQLALPQALPPNRREDCSIRIITHSDWAEFHSAMTSSGVAEIERRLAELSGRFNMHKRNIMLNYMNYVIRRHAHLICPALLQIVETVVHANDHVPIHALVRVFSSHFAEYYETSPASMYCRATATANATANANATATAKAISPKFDHRTQNTHSCAASNYA